MGCKNLNLYALGVAALLIGVEAACVKLKDGDNALKVGNGVRDDNAYPKTIGLLIDRSKDQAYCTGTFVRHDLVLTAAHCTEGASGFSLLTNNGAYKKNKATRFTRHPQNSGHSNGVLREDQIFADLALVQFASQTAPAHLISKLASKAPAAGDPVTIVGIGFNRENGKDSEAGVRRRGSNRIAAVLDAARSSLIALRIGGGNEQALPEQGDSGGPLYDAQQNIVGVVSTSQDGQAFYVNLTDPRSRSYIESSIGRSSSANPTQSPSASPPPQANMGGSGTGGAFPSCSRAGLQGQGFTLSYVAGNDAKYGWMKKTSGNGFSCKGGSDPKFPDCAKACPGTALNGSWGWCQGVDGYSCLN